MTVPLGPVPTTDEKSTVRQNIAIQQLFGAITATLQQLLPRLESLAQALSFLAQAA